MDPDALLAEIRGLADGLPDGAGGGLAELFEALDEWLSTGGHLPNAWERARDV